ncbi:MAG: selenium metabolism-associated LysR family transcriptional regulator [Thermodesulfobacteriota bacterium]
MDLHKLEVFCNVIEQKSFTKAARTLRLSQPTVSEHIRILETEANQQLLNRTGRAVLPTNAGKLLYRYSKKMLRLQEETIQSLLHFSGKMIGRLAIGAGTIPGAYLLPEKIGRFKEHYPDINISLQITGSRTIAGAIMDGELEMGVLGAKWRDSALQWQDIYSDRLSLVAHPSHPWTKKKEISLRELYQGEFILRERNSGTRHATTKILADYGLELEQLNIVAEIGSTEAVRQSVKAGIGLSFLSSLAVKEDLKRNKLAEINIHGVKMQRPLYLVTRKKGALSPLCNGFIEMLLEEL